MKKISNIKNYQREYREANKERLVAQQREYYEANKERLAAQKREYYEANKDTIKIRRILGHY